jgi:hypothetical protein
MTLSQRKQHAARCLIKGGPFTRKYDNCFEAGDGDQVVRYLMNRTQKDIPLMQGIKNQGTWNYWQYFMDHGTYQDYARVQA